MLGVGTPVSESRPGWLALKSFNVGEAYKRGDLDIVFACSFGNEVAEGQLVFRAVPHIFREGDAPIAVPVDFHLRGGGSGAGGERDLMLVRPCDGAELTDKVIA